MNVQDKHKVVLIGDQSVGKTSLMTRLLKGYFNQNYNPTIGTGCGTWESSNGLDKTQLSLWDTAGQEKYRALGQIFYQNSEAAVLVISQDVPLKEQNPDSWVKEFRDVAGYNAYIVVAANKADLENADCSEIAFWARQHNFLHVETSAKTGQGVKEIFELIACEVRRSHERIHNLKLLAKSLGKDPKNKANNCC